MPPLAVPSRGLSIDVSIELNIGESSIGESSIGRHWRESGIRFGLGSIGPAGCSAR